MDKYDGVSSGQTTLEDGATNKANSDLDEKVVMNRGAVDLIVGDWVEDLSGNYTLNDASDVVGTLDYNNAQKQVGISFIFAMASASISVLTITEVEYRPKRDWRGGVITDYVSGLIYGALVKTDGTIVARSVLPISATYEYSELYPV